MIAIAISSLLWSILFKIYLANIHSSKLITESLQIPHKISIIRNIFLNDIHFSDKLVTTPNSLKINDHYYYVNQNQSLYVDNGKEKNEIVKGVKMLQINKEKNLLEIKITFENNQLIPIYIYHE